MIDMTEHTRRGSQTCRKNDCIPRELYKEYGVNLGLRDINGNGVLTGLTNISLIVSSKKVDGKKVPCDGELWYRGYDVQNLIKNLGSNEFGFEKIAYLLLMGELPNEKELAEFKDIIGNSRTLPTNFTRDVIMKAPSSDIMNTMTRSILTLASYDKNPKSTIEVISVSEDAVSAEAASASVSVLTFSTASVSSVAALSDESSALSASEVSVISVEDTPP